MRSIAFATYHALPEVTDDDQLLVDALADAGLAVTAHPWDAAVDWTTYAAVLPRSTWDFHLRLPEFRAWLAKLEASGARVINAPQLLRWNVTKRYLNALQTVGIPVVPTVWVTEVADSYAVPSLSKLVADRGWPSGAVVKPTVSASAHDTWIAHGLERAREDERFRESLAAAPFGLMVQPFLPRIRTHGEWSLMFIGGRYSHSVLKRPADGDFRVQRDYGGTAVRAVPPASLLADATRVLSAVAACTGVPQAEIVYARIDGVEDRGRLLLMEFEAVEPVLFFGTDDGAAARMAKEIRAALTAVTNTGAARSLPTA